MFLRVRRKKIILTLVREIFRQIIGIIKRKKCFWKLLKIITIKNGNLMCEIYCKVQFFCFFWY